MLLNRTTSHRALLTLPLLASVLTLSGCGSERASYGVEDRTLELEQGDSVTLEVPERGFLGEDWFLAGPKPDAEVLRHDGDREEDGENQRDRQFFDFTAGKPGKVTVKLLHCGYGSCDSVAEAEAERETAPGGSIPTAAPGDTDIDSEDNKPIYYVWTVTVR